MLTILFFDLATKSGYAFGSVAGVEESGTIEFSRTGEDYGTLLLQMLEVFGKLIDRIKPTQVGYESPIIPGQSKMQITTLRKLYLMGPALEAECVRRGVRCFEGQKPLIMTHFLGRGFPRDSKRQKAFTQNRCRERGWKFQDDNEADALAGLDWALSCESPAFALSGTKLFGSRK